MKYQTKTLGTVAEYINGRAFKPSEWENNGLPIIRIQNLTNPNAPFNYSSSEHEKKFLIKNGDLLFAWSASLGAHIWNGSDAWLNQHIFKVIPKNDVDKKFLYYYLSKVVSDLYSKAHGTGMVHITKKPFMNTPIPIPDIMSQRIIVKHIEESISQLDSAVETLNKTKQQLEIYRQAVLKEVFSSCDAVEIQCVCEHVTDGDHMPPPKSEQGIPFIMISNIVGNTIDWNGTAFVSKEYYDKIGDKRTPQKGDVLYTVTGSYGIPVLINFDTEFCFQRHIALLRPNKQISQEFLYYALQDSSVYSQASKRATGTAQKTVGLNVLRTIKIPYTDSLETQKKIVENIKTRLSLCDSIKKTVNQSLHQSEALRQSILKQAFEEK